MGNTKGVTVTISSSSLLHQTNNNKAKSPTMQTQPVNAKKSKSGNTQKIVNKSRLDEH